MSDWRLTGPAMISSLGWDGSSPWVNCIEIHSFKVNLEVKVHIKAIIIVIVCQNLLNSWLPRTLGWLPHFIHLHNLLIKLPLTATQTLWGRMLLAVTGAISLDKASATAILRAKAARPTVANSLPILACWYRLSGKGIKGSSCSGPCRGGAASCKMFSLLIWG